MPSMILDTSFLIDVLRGDESVTSWEGELDDRGAGTVTAISVMELWEGIHLADASDAERDRVGRLLHGLTHAAFDQDSAMAAGEINATLVKDGSPIDTEDVMIAAIARTLNEPVLTRNPDHFDRIDGLETETY